VADVKMRRAIAEQTVLATLRDRREARQEAALGAYRERRLTVLDARLGDWRARADASITRCPMCDVPTIHRHAHGGAA
jgi:hypothetical protein